MGRLSIKTSFHTVIICLLLIVLGLAGHFIAAHTTGMPTPTFQDEFAYLLASDTFSHGRLTNPSPPFWEHFQTMHVFVKPTYQAKFPPFQGMFLALGQKLFGAPLWGVWIAMALAYAATYWLFTAVYQPGTALLGTLIVVINPYLQARWGQSYWGGGVAMLGGALFFGGILHSRRSISMANTLFLCLGVVILANSRPFEGLILCFAALPLITQIATKDFESNGGRHTAQKFLLPLGVMSILLIAWILYYNDALSGDPFKFYYHNWDKKSATIDLIRNYKGTAPISASAKLGRLWEFFIGPCLSLSAVGIFFIIRRKAMRFELLSVLILVAASIYRSHAWPHYLAPVASLIYLLVFSGIYEIKRIEFLQKRKWAAACFTMVMILYLVVASLGTIQMLKTGRFRNEKLYVRNQVIRQMDSDNIKDLIFVEYNSTHNVHEEWVYNAADIEQAPIIWARKLENDKNQKLMHYFKNRNVWLLLPDNDPADLIKIRDPEP